MILVDEHTVVNNMYCLAGKLMNKSSMEVDESEDKTPTNEISISSINEMTDNSLLKDSLEGSARLQLDPEDVKMDMVEELEPEKELSSAKDEKDVDQSERDNSVSLGAWLAKDQGEWDFYKKEHI